MASRHDLARILWPSEAPVSEGRVATYPAGHGLDPEAGFGPASAPHPADLEARIAHPLAAIAAELHAIHEALAPGAGRPLSLLNGGNCDAGGNGVVIYDGPRPGNIWRIELIVVSVTGASAAASLMAYNDGPVADEGNLVGFLATLAGNNPSRGFLAPAAPAVVFGGNPFLVRVLGAVANAQITCRIQGENQVIGGD